VSSLDPGTVVDRYRVTEPIGSGAMGEVYLAVDEGLNRKVALKILLDAHRQNPELRARFVREARSVAAIQHPNVVQVFTTGEHDARPYIAMEYLAGQDLGTIVKSVGPLDSLAAASALLDAAQGLQAAARAGLIHRDVKPTNLVRLDAGGVKVTDFGLAKPVDPAGDPALTALGVVVGTPDYIAPEQARGEDIDSRVDVYALGCTLFFLLVGRPPFRKGIDAEDKYLKVVARHLRDPAPDPRKEAPGTDDELAELCLAMMAKSADERPTYPDLIARLDRVRSRLSLSTGAVAAGGSRSEVPMTSPPRSYPARIGQNERTAQHPSSRSLEEGERSLGAVSPAHARRVRRLLWVTTLLAVGVFLTGLGLFLFGSRGTRAAAPSAGVDAGARQAPVDAGVAAAPPAPPAPPQGMILVSSPDGKPLSFVDRAAVSNAEYGAMIRAHRFAKKNGAKPVTGISYDHAETFARLKGKRLLRADEWPAALAADGFTAAGMKIWEWVDDGKGGPRRAVRRAPSGEAVRDGRGSASVTFRLARDL
jgi:serine/threonine-protein kinase